MPRHNETEPGLQTCIIRWYRKQENPNPFFWNEQDTEQNPMLPVCNRLNFALLFHCKIIGSSICTRAVPFHSYALCC